MTCSTCTHHVRDWRLCLHPESQALGFWADAMDYACHTPAKDVPEADFGNIATHPTISPIPAGATPGEQAP
jgi:hypothetical protein